MIPEADPPELHRPLALDRIAPRGTEFVVEANENERAGLAKRLMVPAVRALRCVFKLSPGPSGSVLAVARLTASVTRTCVISLDDFDSDIAEEFAVRFVDSERLSDDDDPETIDEIPISGPAIDLGEAATEQLALVLDPYPRKPDAVLDEGAYQQIEHPFARLAALRRSGDKT